MTKPRITSIRFNTSPIRRQPQAGDMRWLKGRKVWQIRQERKVPAGLPGAGSYVVSNGRQLWEWVDRGSERDRQWAWRAKCGDEPADEYMRAHFEQGCLCLIEGKFSILPRESNAKAVERYMASCTCSRHPNHGINDQ